MAAPLTGIEKAAVLLKSLSPATVDKVLAHMEPKTAKLLSSELVKASQRPDLKEAVSQVLDEAANVLGDKDKPQTRSSVDIKIADTPKETEDQEVEADPIAALGALAPDLLAKALNSEGARTISLLMNRMNVETAGQIYKRLSPAKRKEVSLRFADATVVNDELLRHLASAVLKKCQSLSAGGGTASDEQGEREKRMAGLLRSIERVERAETLTALEETNAELAARIKAMLYLFEDIIRMENSSIQKLLSEIDMKALASALYDAQPEIKDRILTNLSRRAQESLKEEIELTGKVQSAKVRQARQTLEEAMQRLDQRGELLMMET